MKALQKINDGVVQASVRQIKKKDDAGADGKSGIWMLHITLKSEDAGRDLMASYLHADSKKVLQPFFNGEPFLNIFCSAAFRKEFKKAKSNWKSFEKTVKSGIDYNRKLDFESRGVKTMARFPPMQPIPPMNMQRPPSMGPMGAMPMMMPPMGVNPQMMMPFMAGPMMGPARPADNEAKKQEFLRTRDDPAKNQVASKKTAVGFIIKALDDMGYKDSRRIAGIKFE